MELDSSTIRMEIQLTSHAQLSTGPGCLAVHSPQRRQLLLAAHGDPHWEEASDSKPSEPLRTSHGAGRDQLQHPVADHDG